MSLNMKLTWLDIKDIFKVFGIVLLLMTLTAASVVFLFGLVICIGQACHTMGIPMHGWY